MLTIQNVFSVKPEPTVVALPLLAKTAYQATVKSPPVKHLVSPAFLESIKMKPGETGAGYAKHIRSQTSRTVRTASPAATARRRKRVQHFVLLVTGKYMNESVCESFPAGWSSIYGQPECTECPQGRRQQSKTRACTLCPPGKHGNPAWLLQLTETAACVNCGGGITLSQRCS